MFVRKAEKPYGTRQLAEGTDVAGRRVLVVEDVITPGGQVALSTADLREHGAVIDEALCVVDREAGGAERLAKHRLRRSTSRSEAISKADTVGSWLMHPS